MSPLEAQMLQKLLAQQYGPSALAGNTLDYFTKPGAAGPMQKVIGKDTASLVRHIPGVSARGAVKVGRFAGRLAPGISAVGNIADVAELITGEESLANKTMDATSMGIGGAAGFMLGGPLGASVGAGLGKTASDGLQYLFGDKKTPDQRRMEEALALLNSGRF